MSRLLVLGFLSLCSSLAIADVSLQSFSWGADARFALGLSIDGTPVLVKETLRAGDKTSVKQGEVTVNLHSYVGGFVTVAISLDNREMGAVFVLEWQISQTNLLNPRAIPGRKLTLLDDLEGIVVGLNKVNSWDASLALRSLVEYFRNNSDRVVGDFYDEVELGHIREVAKPRPVGGTGTGATVNTPRLPPSARPVHVPDGPVVATAVPLDLHPRGAPQPEVDPAIEDPNIDQPAFVPPPPTLQELEAQRQARERRRRARALELEWQQRRRSQQDPYYPQQPYFPRNPAPPRQPLRQPNLLEQLFGE